MILCTGLILLFLAKDLLMLHTELQDPPQALSIYLHMLITTKVPLLLVLLSMNSSIIFFLDILTIELILVLTFTLKIKVLAAGENLICPL